MKSREFPLVDGTIPCTDVGITVPAIDGTFFRSRGRRFSFSEAASWQVCDRKHVLVPRQL